MASLLTLENIHKTFEAGTVNENHVLKGLDLEVEEGDFISVICLLYTSPSPRDPKTSRMPSSA